MEHKNRWLNRTHLSVTKLEDRVTPSIINGLDLGDLILPEDQPAFKRPKASEIMQIVNPALADVQLVTGPSKVFVGSEKTPAAQAIQVVNPAMRPPVAQRNVEATNRPNTFRVEAQAKAAPKPTFVEMDFHATRNPVTPSISATNVPSADVGGDSRAGLWATYFKPGSDFQDGVNEIAANTNPAEPGTSFACGFQGQRATIRKYSAAGIEIGATNFTVVPGTGQRKACLAIDVSPVAPYNVYVAIRMVNIFPPDPACAANLCENSILVGPNSLGPSGVPIGPCVDGAYTAGVWTGDRFCHPGAGAEVENFEDIAVGPGGTDVYVTGRADDGGGGSLILDFHYDGALTSGGISLGSWPFPGVDVNGYSVAADPVVVGKRYLGGSYDDVSAQYPLWMDVPADGLNNWVWLGLYLVPTPYDQNRMGGIEVDPTGVSLYLGGSVDDAGFFTYNTDSSRPSQTYENLFIAQVSTATGAIGSGAYGFIYVINDPSPGLGLELGGDYAARNLTILPDSCVLNDCSVATTGFVDDEALTSDGNISPDVHFGDLSEFDVAGDLVSFKDLGDTSNGLNITTNGSGIDAVDFGGDDIFEVVSGGLTGAGNAAEGAPDPYGGAPMVDDTCYGSACGGQLQGSNSGHGAPADGYVEGDSLPFAPSAARPVIAVAI